MNPRCALTVGSTFFLPRPMLGWECGQLMKVTASRPFHGDRVVRCAPLVLHLDGSATARHGHWVRASELCPTGDQA